MKLDTVCECHVWLEWDFEPGDRREGKISESPFRVVKTFQELTRDIGLVYVGMSAVGHVSDEEACLVNPGSAD
jgi:hypothetical protein